MMMKRVTRSAVLLACCSVGKPAFVFAADHPPPLVMLANVYDSEAAAEIDLSDYWVSEKYDGIRAYWDGRELLTREGNRIHAPAWFVAGWPHAALDGELWVGRGLFEEVSATVLDAHPDDAAWRRVRYMVFDLPAHAGSFTQRLAALASLLSDLPVPWVRLVPQVKVADRAALERKLQEVVTAGGEGLMLHRGSSHYRGGRTEDLLKFKPIADAEARVIAYLPGKGKYSGLLGALVVQRPDGLRFSLGSGFTDAQRRDPPPLGSWITYNYQGLTENGIPRFARFVRVRGDLRPP
ncbi:MAG TPA: DNA ligase [Gammaproteobacteria bacterium]|nr:DNA ligase [Gammaproteobacteria bacterium]